MDWVFDAGFDFMTTESGLSEFTYPDCSLMRDLLEEFSTYVNVTWGREALVKVHCSPGQTCADFIDPRTGEPVNFNHLPMFVDGSLGVMPHTIQVRTAVIDGRLLRLYLIMENLLGLLVD